MQWFDVEQGSSEWWELRRGIPTASEFSRIITPAKGQTGGAGSKSYLAQLIGEKLATFLPANVQTYTSRAMQWGQETEAQARRFFSMETNLDVTNGGFCLTDDGRFGASPDFLAGDDAVGELKCPQPGQHVEYLLEGKLPDEYKYQCHGHLLVTGRPLCWFMSYCPGLPPLLVRVEPSKDTDALRVAVDDFCDRYATALAKVRGT